MTDADLSPTPSRKRIEQRRWTVLFPVVGLIALAAAGLVLFALGSTSIGLEPILVGAAAALIPVAFVVSAFLWIDRWEPEPAKLLLFAFFWGACGATISSLVFNQTSRVVGDILTHGGGGDFTLLVGAPVVEEAAKAAFLIAVYLRRRHEFDGVVDGMVYAGITAAGFAFTENIWYFGRIFAQQGFGDLEGGVVALFLLRGVLSPFAHPLFTSMTGIGVGIAASSSRAVTRVVAPIAGYLAAVGLHAGWNAMTKVETGSAFINLYFLVMVPLFAGAVGIVVWQRRREQRIVAGQLAAMAQNRWIANSEVALLASLNGRRNWLRAVKRKSGDSAARSVRNYQIAVTELAFLRHRIEQGTAGQSAEQRHGVLLDTLHAARTAARG
ncbi:PrsW family intramembrane metalloprotease [Nocardia sp. NRRL S-836]|uniref:PrsW family intramembrane metalloprotease n=1 Tax=Nocardia sp. NRRL S-836 TaxID=1519492 RepID=UPI000A4DE176|nr:PrsW family intramembrane metalloprotease [Nocardia sp. NRRL S-836]